MLEDFEEFDNTAAFLDELDMEDTEIDMEMELDEEPPRRSRKSMPAKRLMGMTPVQWFVISFEVFLMVAIMGLFFMIITGKMVLPL
jgi:hypothetical protein